MNIHKIQIDPEEKQRVNKAIDDIANTADDTERWRKIAKFAVNSSPAAYQQHLAVLEEVKQLRQDIISDYGASADKNSNMRYALKLPRVVNDMLEAMGEDLYKPHLEAEESRKHLRKVAKAFPEYRVYRRI